MRRRSFLTVFGGAAAARAQRHERMRRIGVLTGVAADDQEAQARKIRAWSTVQHRGFARDIANGEGC